VGKVLQELSVVEQRYEAVSEVLRNGATVVEVADRVGVSRQTIHDWIKRYAALGIDGLKNRQRPAQRPAAATPTATLMRLPNYAFGVALFVELRAPLRRRAGRGDAFFSGTAASAVLPLARTT
jgi:transposase-like protein